MTTVVDELQKLLAGPANLTTDEAVAVAMAIALLKAQAAQPAHAHAIDTSPEGWQLVPVEPMEAMLDAGQNAQLFSASKRSAHLVYQAMLSAAPSTKEQSNG